VRARPNLHDGVAVSASAAEFGGAMPRVPGVRRDDLLPEQWPVFDRLAESRVLDDGVIHGPFGMLLHNPAVAGLAADLGAYFRYNSPLPEPTRHLLALTVARELSCQYEFAVHADLGLKEGLSDATIEAIRMGREPDGVAPLDLAVYRFVRQLVRHRRVSEAALTALVDQLGLKAVTEVVGNVGWLMFLSCPLNAFEVEVRPEHRRYLDEPSPSFEE
jgi:4-carboxymuconolactone decarboxylase